MNCKELMVGDWVICNHYQDKPFTKQFGVADFAKGEYEFCEPIPLTEDILVKNGFEKFAESQTLFDYTDNDIHLEYWIGDGCFRYYTAEIRYVHTLQHLLRLCGIDKEIKL